MTNHQSESPDPQRSQQELERYQELLSGLMLNMADPAETLYLLGDAFMLAMSREDFYLRNPAYEADMLRGIFQDVYAVLKFKQDQKE